MKKNHINILLEKYKYIDSCLEASDGWTRWDNFICWNSFQCIFPYCLTCYFNYSTYSCFPDFKIIAQWCLTSHTFQPPSSSKWEACNYTPKVAPWLPKFWILGSLKAWKFTLQKLLFSEIIPRKLNFALSSRENFLVLEYPPNITIGTSIIVYLIPQHFSWLKNYKLYWFSNSSWRFFC